MGGRRLKWFVSPGLAPPYGRTGHMGGEEGERGRGEREERGALIRAAGITDLDLSGLAEPHLTAPRRLLHVHMGPFLARAMPARCFLSGSGPSELDAGAQ